MAFTKKLIKINNGGGGNKETQVTPHTKSKGKKSVGKKPKKTQAGKPGKAKGKKLTIKGRKVNDKNQKKTRVTKLYSDAISLINQGRSKNIEEDSKQAIYFYSLGLQNLSDAMSLDTSETRKPKATKQFKTFLKRVEFLKDKIKSSTDTQVSNNSGKNGIPNSTEDQIVKLYIDSKLLLDQGNIKNREGKFNEAYSFYTSALENLYAGITLDTHITRKPQALKTFKEYLAITEFLKKALDPRTSNPGDVFNVGADPSSAKNNTAFEANNGNKTTHGLNTADAPNSPDQDQLYIETQEDLFCGKHAINHLMQEDLVFLGDFYGDAREWTPNGTLRININAICKMWCSDQGGWMQPTDCPLDEDSMTTWPKGHCEATGKFSSEIIEHVLGLLDGVHHTYKYLRWKWDGLENGTIDESDFAELAHQPDFILEDLTQNEKFMGMIISVGNGHDPRRGRAAHWVAITRTPNCLNNFTYFDSVGTYSVCGTRYNLLKDIESDARFNAIVKGYQDLGTPGDIPPEEAVEPYRVEGIICAYNG